MKILLLLLSILMPMLITDLPSAEAAPLTPYASYRSSDIVADGATVTAWQCREAPARNLTLTDGSPRAWLVRPSGDSAAPRPVVRFDGHTGIWQTVESWGRLAGDHTIVAFVRLAPRAHGTLCDGSSRHATAPITLAADQTPPGRWHAISFVVRERPLGGFILGTNFNGGEGLAGDIGEIAVYDHALSDAERDAAVQAMTERWGDPVDLPADRQPREKAAPGDPRVFRKTLLRMGDYGVNTYRIPGLITTPKGTLLATFDMRNKSDDDLPGDIDVGLIRSTDNGKTWSDPQRILTFPKDDPKAQGNGVGDACILADRQTGHVFVAGLWSHGNRSWWGSGPGLTPDATAQLVITESADDGRTWSKPVSITPMVKDPSWNLLFQGPGRGIQTKNGTLVFPAQFKAADKIAHSCLLYSPDHGKTWKLTPAALPGTDPTSESQVAECADGSLLLSMRNETHAGVRVWARWEWKGSIANGAWSAPWYTVTDPTCMASLIRVPGGPRLLFSNPNDAHRRIALTIRASTDGGKTWSDGRLLDPNPCGYSCMTVLNDGSIGILYETGGAQTTERLAFAHFPLDWATETDPSRALAGGAKDLEAIRTKLADPKTPLTWVFTGDSITQGALHTHGARIYPELFEERVRWEMNRRRDVTINTGISGDTAAGILADWNWRVARFHPDIVSVNIGMNDAVLFLKTPETYEKNLNEIVTRIRALGAIPILQTTNTIAPTTDRAAALPAFNAIIYRVAAQGNVLLVDNWKDWNAAGAETTASWRNDPIHPNGAGHAEIARELFRTLDIYSANSATCQLYLK